VFGEARPGGDGPGAPLRQASQAPDEVGPVPIVAEDGTALEGPHHDVMEGVGGIEARLAGHEGSDGITSRHRIRRPGLRRWG